MELTALAGFGCRNAAAGILADSANVLAQVVAVDAAAAIGDGPAVVVLEHLWCVVGLLLLLGGVLLVLGGVGSLGTGLRDGRPGDEFKKVTGGILDAFVVDDEGHGASKEAEEKCSGGELHFVDCCLGVS